MRKRIFFIEYILNNSHSDSTFASFSTCLEFKVRATKSSYVSDMFLNFSIQMIGTVVWSLLLVNMILRVVNSFERKLLLH